MKPAPRKPAGFCISAHPVLRSMLHLIDGDTVDSYIGAHPAWKSVTNGQCELSHSREAEDAVFVWGS
jgi:hypothetical protein